MMRCVAGMLSMALLFTMLTGCTKQCFLAEKDFENALSHLPPHLESDPTVGVTPVTGGMDRPVNVDDPDRPPRHITLQEAIAISLENGTVSDRTGQGGTGIANDQFFTFTGGSLAAQSDRIRVLAMNPAIAATGIEQSLARFDAHWVNTASWSGTDELLQGLQSFSNGGNATIASTIAKQMSTGGVISTTFQNDYRDLTRPPANVVNPLYTSRLSIGYEQPLWRDFGTDINQLLARFPSFTGSAMPSAVAGALNNKLLPLNQGSQLSGGSFFTDGILIARLRFDSQRAEFERNLNNLVLNVEVAYWNLYKAYGTLYAFEEVMRIAHKVWMNYDAKYKAGNKGLADFAPIRAQYEEFRGERLKALGAVLDAERNLRRIMGIAIEDGTRLVPVTAPTLAPFQANWDSAVKDALGLGPELVIARENLRLAQFNLITQKNFLKPDVRFFGQYTPIGFGTNLDGNGTFSDATGTPRPTNAFRSLVTDHFNDWTVGLAMNMPLGFRLEHASVRAAKLNLAQSYEVLKDQEERTKSVLTQQYQKLSEWQQRIGATNAERRAYGDAVDVRYRELVVGKTTVADFLLDVQRRFALALTKEYEAIAEYNNSLARFEWAKGTLLPFNNVNISEGALPECVQVRAVENERKRTHALLLSEKNPAPMSHPGRLIGNLDGPPQTLEENAKNSPHAASVPADFLNAPLGKNTASNAGPTGPATDLSTKTGGMEMRNRLPLSRVSPMQHKEESAGDTAGADSIEKLPSSPSSATSPRRFFPSPSAEPTTPAPPSVPPLAPRRNLPTEVDRRQPDLPTPPPTERPTPPAALSAPPPPATETGPLTPPPSSSSESPEVSLPTPPTVPPQIPQND